jgi:hypothetical protein
MAMPGLPAAQAAAVAPVMVARAHPDRVMLVVVVLVDMILPRVVAAARAVLVLMVILRWTRATAPEVLAARST